MYPTKEQIMAREHKFRPGVLAAVREWKREHYRGWKDKDLVTKHYALAHLVGAVADLYEYPVAYRAGDVADHYDRASGTIMINFGNPSIVTALHELGHHLKGGSELAACRFSVWLFKKAFPRSFERLHFEGHLLRQ